MSLRVLLAATVLLGTLGGLYVDRARRQRAVTEWVLSGQGTIAYDYETDTSKLNQREWIGNGWAPSPWQKMDGRPVGPKFVRDFLGIDYLSTVVGVAIWDADFPITDLSKLKWLPNLQHLEVSFQGSPDCDFSAISDLTELRRLELYGCKMEELPQLDQLKNLQVIYLYDTGITKICPISKLSKLERVEIDSRIENTSALADLTDLKWVSIQTVNFDIEDFRNLRTLEYLEIDTLNCPYKEADLKKLDILLPNTEVTIYSNDELKFESEYHDESKYETTN